MDELDLLRRMGEQEPAVDAEARTHAWERLHRHQHPSRRRATPLDGPTLRPQKVAGWWMRFGEFALVIVGVVVLVGAVALLAHRSPGRPQSPPPRYHGVTYITSSGEIAAGDPHRIGTFRIIVPNHLRVDVPNHRIVAFGWSPDGEKIAYLTNSRTPEPFETSYSGSPGRCTIQVRDLATKRTVALATWRPHTYRCKAGEDVAWSPDGRFIAFERNRQVVVMESNGYSQRVVGVARDAGLTWWPGGRIAYMCHHWEQWCAVRPDGSRRTQIPGRYHDVVWSLQSGRIAYTTDARLRVQVWTARPDGTDARMVFSPKQMCCVTHDTTVAWSPDGKKLVAMVPNGYVIDLRSGHTQTQPWLEGAIYLPRPSWQPAPTSPKAEQ